MRRKATWTTTRSGSKRTLRTQIPDRSSRRENAAVMRTGEDSPSSSTDSKHPRTYGVRPRARRHLSVSPPCWVSPASVPASDDLAQPPRSTTSTPRTAPAVALDLHDCSHQYKAPAHPAKPAPDSPTIMPGARVNMAAPSAAKKASPRPCMWAHVTARLGRLNGRRRDGAIDELELSSPPSRSGHRKRLAGARRPSPTAARG